MSADTKTALEEALAAHIADECDGDMPAAYVVVAETTNLDDFDNDMSSRFVITRNGQSVFTSDGLLWHTLTNAGTRDED